MSTQPIRISDIVAVPHLDNFNSDKLHQIDYGGRAGYKSSKNAIKIALKMLQDPTCEVVVVREDYSDHKDSTFADLKIAFMRLGVNLQQGIHYPKGNDLWIQLPQGNFVHFAHMKNIDKLKGTRPRNPHNQIKIIWYFEITQFKSDWFINESNATFMRGEKDYFFALYEFNNAPKLSHWTYEWLEKMKKRDDTYTKKTNYNDAPKWQQLKFLGKIILKEIEKLKDIDPEQYKSTYLGFPANLSGTVYKQFDIDRHIKPALENYMDIIIGVDYGGNDATVCTARGVRPDYSGMDIIATWYHKNGVTGGIKNINEYTQDILTFAQIIYSKYKIPITMYIDSANNTTLGMLIEEATYTEDYAFILLKKLPKMKKRKGTKKEKRVIQERIDVAEIMFGSNYINIDPSCKELIKALQECEYNDKGERADDGRSDIDSIDSFEYTWLDDMDLINDIIMR